MSSAQAQRARAGAGALAQALRRQAELGVDTWNVDAGIGEALLALETALRTDNAPSPGARTATPASPAPVSSPHPSAPAPQARPSSAPKPVEVVHERPASPRAPDDERMPWVPQSVVASQDTLAGAAGLDAIRAEIGDCRRCRLCERRTNIVFGVGDPQARLMFIGEGPGADEDASGEPFVGKAGQLLDRMIVAMGLSREQVYIANVVKCRPPENRDPEADEVRECEPFLNRQIDAVRPDVIVVLGRVAFQALTRSKRSITRARGTWFEYRGVPTMPTLHPAYLLRTPDAKRDVWADLQQVMARLAAPAER